MAITLLAPVLRVADVARSMQWYRDTLAFVRDPFPAKPPFELAILRHGPVELMLRRGTPPVRTCPRQNDWDVYLRREGDRYRAIAISIETSQSGLAPATVTVPFFLYLLQSFQKRIVQFDHPGSNQLSQMFVCDLGVLPV